MPTTPRGAPYPSLASANDPPRDLQLLAEWADAQLETLDDATFKRRGFTLPEPFSVTNSSVGNTAIPALTTSFAVQAGRLYRITVQITTYSTTVQDVAQFRLDVSGLGQVGEFPRAANSARDTALTANAHTLVAYCVSPTAGTRTVTVYVSRPVGTGTVTAMADALKRASCLVEDIGAA